MNRRLEELLVEAGKRGFMVHSFDPQLFGPAVLALTYDHDGFADVFILHTQTRATAYRTPTGPGIDVLAPTSILCSMELPPVPTLAALLALDPPGHPDAHVNLYEAPPGLGLPAEGRRPVIMRMRDRR